MLGWLRNRFLPRTERLRVRLAEAQLEYEDAQYEIDVWGFSDSPKQRAEKEKRAKKAWVKLEHVRSDMGHLKLEDLIR